MVGSAFVRHTTGRKDVRLLTVPRTVLDLTDRPAVEQFLSRRRPDLVIVAAGRVGGIRANAAEPASFLHENLQIATHLIHGSWKAGVQRLVYLGSSCMYPRDCSQPMRPEQLMTGPLEPTSEPYAVAKWVGLTLCRSYNRQCGTRFMAVIPCTLYGPNDNFDPEEGHVLSALIRRFHEARERGQEEVVLWGSGKPKREFLYVDDLPEAVDRLLQRYEGNDPINIGSGQAISIAELAQEVARVVGFRGRIRWDRSQPDGAPEKRLDSAPLRELGWAPRTDLRSGLGKTYRWFLEQKGCISL